MKPDPEIIEKLASNIYIFTKGCVGGNNFKLS